MVDRGVLADGGVRAAAGLDAADPLGGSAPRAHEELGVLVGVDVVGDDREAVAIAQPLAQPVEQRRLARSDRPADADCDTGQIVLLATPFTRAPEPGTPNPKPGTPNPEPQTPEPSNPEPGTPNRSPLMTGTAAS